MTDQEKSGKAKGGLARAAKLTQEERSTIARKGALAKKANQISTNLPRAIFGSRDNPLMIGDLSVGCYVLEDGTRVLTQESFLTVLGRAAKAKGGQGVRTVVDNLPPFLAAANLKPLIDIEITTSTAPIEFLSPTGAKVYGYPAELLPEVCRVYLSARDKGILLQSQEHIAARSDMLVRALASIGIVALVDEVTGYQEIRDKKALSALLDKYLLQEFAKWAKRFPDSFYKEMFRLRGWAYPSISGGKPGVVGHFTMDIVYQRLAPGLVKELETRNPKEVNGRRKSTHHQWLTEDVGHPALSEHIHAVTGLMRASDNWDQFKRLLDRSFPVKGDQLPLLFDE